MERQRADALVSAALRCEQDKRDLWLLVTAHKKQCGVGRRMIVGTRSSRAASSNVYTYVRAMKNQEDDQIKINVLTESTPARYVSLQLQTINLSSAREYGGHHEAETEPRLLLLYCNDVR